MNTQIVARPMPKAIMPPPMPSDVGLAEMVKTLWRQQMIGVPGAVASGRYLSMPLVMPNGMARGMTVCLAAGSIFRPFVADCDDPLVMRALKDVWTLEGDEGLLRRYPDLEFVRGGQDDGPDTILQARTYDVARLGLIVWQMHALAQAAIDVADAYGADDRTGGVK